jgi:hypothetical protein
MCLTLPVSNNSLIVAHHVIYFVSLRHIPVRKIKYTAKPQDVVTCLDSWYDAFNFHEIGVLPTVNFNNVLYIFPEWRIRNCLGSTTYTELIPEIWLSLFHYVHNDNIIALHT